MSALHSFTSKAAAQAKAIEMASAGHTQRQIAAQIGRGQSTVHRWVAGVRQEWRDQAIDDLGAMVASELDRLAHLEREALTAWEASKRSALGGDGKFLDVALRVSARRSKLLALDGVLSRTTPATTETAPVDQTTIIEDRLARYAAMFGTGVIEMVETTA